MEKSFRKQAEVFLETLWRGTPVVDGTLGRYLFFGLAVFLTSLFASYLLFRIRPLELSVRLVPVKVQVELAQTIEAQGELNPIRSVQLTAVESGRLDRFLAKSGDPVKKDQVIAVSNEAEGRALLESSLDKFKLATAAFVSIKRKPQSGSTDAYKETEARFKKSKADLELARKKMESSMIHSPTEGILWIGDARLGDPLRAGSRIAQVEDVSELVIPFRIPASRAKDLPCECKITLSPEPAPGNEKPISALAEVHYMSVDVDVSASDAEMEFVLPSDGIPLGWLHRPLHVTVSMPPLTNVALVDRKAVLSTGKESRVLILGASGTLHWKKIPEPRVYGDSLVLEGVDPKLSRVVFPENIDLVNRAISLNARPFIDQGG